MQVPYLKVIDSKNQLVLLGVDFCAPGRSYDRWNYGGLPVQTGEDGEVQGWITFHKGSIYRKVKLLNVPKVGEHGKKALLALAGIKA